MFKTLLAVLAASLFAGSAYATDISLDGIMRLNSTAGTSSTCNSKACVLTTPSTSITSSSTYSITITDSLATVGDIVLWSIGNGSNTQGVPVAASATPSAGGITFVIANAHVSQALNGTLKIVYWLLKP